MHHLCFFFFQAEDGIRDLTVTGVQTCALPIVWISAGPESLPLNIAPDVRLLAFTFLISLVTALLFGTLPALRSTHVNLTDAFKSGRGAAALGVRSRFSRDRKSVV